MLYSIVDSKRVSYLGFSRVLTFRRHCIFILNSRNDEERLSIISYHQRMNIETYCGELLSHHRIMRDLTIKEGGGC
jgi:hypothetical protein